MKIFFGVDGKNSLSTGPYTVWKNIKLKSSNLWSAAYVEVNNISYGPVLKPTQHHIIEMNVNTNTYKSQILINNKPVFEDKHYILGKLIVTTNKSSLNENDIVDFIECSYYDH